MFLWGIIYRCEPYTGWPRNNGTVDTVDFSGLCCNQNLFSSPFLIEHLFPIIITPRSSDLVENFLFYETFLMDCHFRDLPDFQSFEARWQINGKSKKWQSIRNYSWNIKFSTKFGDLGVIIMRKKCSIQQGKIKITVHQSKVLKKWLFRFFEGHPPMKN